MAFFTLYFDDSGTHPESPVAIAAAWIAPVHMWRRFEKEWEAAKDKYGFRCFHASECMASQANSEFAQWSDEKKIQVTRRLIQLTRKQTSKGFAIAINKKDYDELVPNELRSQMGENHYTWAVRALLGAIENWREKHSPEKADYIFDQMPDQKGMRDKKREIEEIFEKTAQQKDSLHRYGVYEGCLSFRRRCIVTPLQAADLWAWSVYQRSHNFVSDKPVLNIAIEAFNRFTDQHHAEAYMATREQLADFVNQQLKAPKKYEGEPPRMIPNPARHPTER